MAPRQCNQAMPASSTDRWDSGGCYCASDTRANSQSEWSTKFSETETTVKRADGALVHESGSGNCRPGELVGRSRRTRQSETRYCGAQTARFIFHWLLRRQNPDGRRGILGQKRLLTFWSVAHRVCMHVLWNKLTPSLSFANSRTWNRVQHASCCQNDAFLSYFENALNLLCSDTVTHFQNFPAANSYMLHMWVPFSMIAVSYRPKCIFANASDSLISCWVHHDHANA